MSTAAYLGIDLAWGEGTATRPANETGLAALDPDGTVVDAGWARGLDAVEAWIVEHTGPRTLVAVDASLVVTNPPRTMRAAERQVGQRYGRWRVSANTTNTGSRHRAGALLLERLTAHGIGYVDSTATMHARTGPAAFECYPYTTLVGVAELAYDDERPRYKRLDPAVDRTTARRRRAAAFDELVRRLDRLGRSGLPPLDPRSGLPPLDLRSHAATRELLDVPADVVDRPYKHREDLLDGVVCAWTAALWDLHGDDRVQVLGVDAPDAPDAAGRRAVIVAPARAEQRRPVPGGAVPPG